MKPARITKPEKQEIAKMRSNFRAKYNRLIKQGVSPSMLPSKADITITGMETRAEINEIKKTMKSFTNRANQNYQFVRLESGFTTKPKYNEMKRLQNQVNKIEQAEYRRNRDKEYRVISEKMRGITGTKRTVEQDRHKTKPLKYSRSKFKSEADLEKYKKQLKGRRERIKQRNVQLRANIIDTLKRNYGDYADDMIKIVQNIKERDLIDLFETTDIFKELLDESEDKYLMFHKSDFVDRLRFAMSGGEFTGMSTGEKLQKLYPNTVKRYGKNSTNFNSFLIDFVEMEVL